MIRNLSSRKFLVVNFKKTKCATELFDTSLRKFYKTCGNLLLQIANMPYDTQLIKP
jgi:hypothetical protein